MEDTDLAVRFVVTPEVIEIQMTGSKGPKRHVSSEEEEESKAMLGSLMDEVEFDTDGSDRIIARMAKYKPDAET